MSPSTPSRIQTIAHHTWRAAYTNPSLLVSGLTAAILTLFTESILFSALGTSQEALSADSFRTLLSSVSLFVLLVLPVRAFASSQIFLLQSGDFFRRPDLLTPRTRFIGGCLYVATEILSTSVFLGILYFILSVPLFNSESTNTPSPLATSILLGALFFITIIKRLTVGYLLLSPLRLRSSLTLSVRLFVRYRYFSMLAFFFVLFLTFLFTILENLVMLQYAFIGQHLVLSGVFVYAVLLLANTLISILTEVFWLNFFLTLTNKSQKTTCLEPIIQKELSKAPLTPS
ncbi:MAG: hypothetical protein KA054_00845 [Candidatus Moranbacteria bacterium]|nr:hypothetical protein [Candidatus Moranbacteria bacterium]